MVQAAPLPFSNDMPRRKFGHLPIISMGLLACAALLAASHLGASQAGPVELDRRESEIQQLQREKAVLEQQLSHKRQPLIHPATIKAAVATPAKSVAARQAAVHHTVKKPAVSDLMSEKKALEQQLATTAKDSAGDPWVAGVLGTFKSHSGDGLLGHLKDTTDNVMGSLAATMTSAQKLKMLTNEAKAMGDVSPKEALAQRVISIGKDLLEHKHSSAALAPLPAVHAAHTQKLQSMKMQAAARLAQRHSAALPAHESTAAARAAPHSEAVGKKESVSAARARVALLRKELSQAQQVEGLEEALARAKAQMHHTEAKMSVGGGQQLAGRLEGGAGKFETASASAKAFLGLNAQDGQPEEQQQQSHEEEEEEEDEEAAEKKAEDCRMTGDCHAKGYVEGGVVVGTAENTGPDRYGQLGAGPQLLKGRVGDNVVGAGLLGATGVYEDDVLVPTRLSGVRARDTFRSNENPRVFKNLDPETRHELIYGSVLHHYGERRKLGIADERVPLKGIKAGEYKDRARMQQLATH